jgi:hypothetical protein
VVVLAVIALAAGTALAATAPTSPLAARRIAPSILEKVRLPRGAIRARTDPSGGALARPAVDPVTPNLVDLHRFWRVPGDAGQVFTWIEAHPPPGSKRTMTVTAVGGARVRSVGFSFVPPSWGGAPSETLLVTVAAARGGGSALRADAQVVWLRRRPATERIPAGVRSITVSEPGLHGQPSGRWTVADAARVRRAVSLIDGLPAAQPGVVACPNDTGRYITLAFGSRTGADLATAVVDGSGCLGVSLSIRGRQQHGLQGYPALVKQLSTALGVQL